MDDGLTAIGLWLTVFVCLLAICGSLIGAFVFFKQKKGVWNGLFLGGFSGLIFGLSLLAAAGFALFSG